MNESIEVTLDDVERGCLAEALVMYILDHRDDIHQFESDPADASDAIDLALRLGVLDLVREYYTASLLQRDIDHREDRDAFEWITRQLRTDGEDLDRHDIDPAEALRNHLRDN